MSSPIPVKRICLLIGLAVLVPGLPFLLLGEKFEKNLTAALPAEWPLEWTAAAVIGVLSADIVLPVPSSAVATLAGTVLGFTGGVLAIWLGLTIGVVVGFALARSGAASLLPRLAKESDQRDLKEWGARHGVWLLLITRPLPLIAEATVVLFGLLQLGWRPFLFAVVISNLAIAIVYAWIGVMAVQGEWVHLAIIGSAVIPLLMTLGLRLAFPSWRVFGDPPLSSREES